MCDSPLEAFKTRDGEVKFGERPDGATPLLLSCGRCNHCRVQLIEWWVARCRHEAQLHPKGLLASWFLTLTLGPDFADATTDVDLSMVQLFVKRLRHALGPGVRFQALGEYGGHTHRAHYHLTLLGVDLPAVDLPYKSRAGYPAFKCSLIEKLWPYGHVLIGRASPATFRYIAAHQLKDLNGAYSDSRDYYVWDSETDDLRKRARPFRTQSNRPGIGHGWIERYYRDVYSVGTGAVVFDGTKFLPPKYYDRWLEKNQPSMWERVQMEREEAMAADEALWNATPERRAVKATVRKARRGHKRDARSQFGDDTRIVVPGGSVPLTPAEVARLSAPKARVIARLRAEGLIRGAVETRHVLDFDTGEIIDGSCSDVLSGVRPGDGQFRVESRP